MLINNWRRSQREFMRPLLPPFAFEVYEVQLHCIFVAQNQKVSACQHLCSRLRFWMFFWEGIVRASAVVMLLLHSRCVSVCCPKPVKSVARWWWWLCPMIFDPFICVHPLPVAVGRSKWIEGIERERGRERRNVVNSNRAVRLFSVRVLCVLSEVKRSNGRLNGCRPVRAPCCLLCLCVCVPLLSRW